MNKTEPLGYLAATSRLGPSGGEGGYWTPAAGSQPRHQQRCLSGSIPREQGHGDTVVPQGAAGRTTDYGGSQQEEEVAETHPEQAWF